MEINRVLVLFSVCFLASTVAVNPVSAVSFEQVTYVGFYYDTNSGDSPLTVQFTPVVESTQPIGRCEWDFGDGTPVQTSTYIPVSHTYTDPGTYSVTLTAYNDCGLQRGNITENRV